MPLTKGARGRTKEPIHFVNARPTSENEKLRIQRLVRAHVGKWISDQTKDRSSAGESSDSNSNREETCDPASQIFEIDTEETLFPSSSSPSAGSSRESPESTISRSLSLSIQSASHVPLPPIASSHTYERREDDTEGHCEYSPCQAVVDATRECTRSPGQENGPLVSYTIAAIGSNAFDPFHTYPSHYTPEVVHACERYCIDVLWPKLTPPTPGDRDVSATKNWLPLSLSDPVLFTAILFGSLSHQRCRWVNKQTPDGSFSPRDQRLLEQCEYETIKLVNKAFSDPDQNRILSDSIILSVVCMAHNIADDNDRRRHRPIPFKPPLTQLQWLDVYASLPPNLVHLRGLTELIKLRGGLKNIKLPGLATTVAFSAILTASYLLSQPTFEYIPFHEPRQGLTLQELLGYTSLDVELGFGRLCQIGFTPEMADVFQALRVYTNIIIDHIKVSHPNPDLSLLCDQRNLVQYHLLNLPSARHLPTWFPTPHHQTIYETCRLAALIYAVGVTFPLPFQCSPLPRLANLLQETLQQTPDATPLWTHPNAQIALLWALTLGGIAAENRPERAWFVHTLAQAASSNGIYFWPKLKSVLEFMLWYDAACDEAGYSLWLEVAGLL
ncbi:hypothetical protein KXV22_000295 [Aspergillus fumigatus]|uniref:Uncharacterized protein n=2 Tax=Aspergillus fumigatus TaxID=746128 RepID=Q4WAL0_ASPFU|nr:conserved hypothetical protein [Aspergillus fumigatus Af293]KAH1331864.1 hypothetical protein KXX47_004189 [Aspergillus fumigatus]EAL84726.1 conserved hypothetical protein [Aspergillus fumigatus Af293]KAH1371317.1 hypothetical protein KXX14_006365 [Aspergillus fumigatus]KAH1436492.1 hypothetical protein KXX32_006117 [Aspergillus fumigatus]KAH1463656.1 hypothetical protein KXX58_007015 [Aspergillus fumigatus]